MVDFQGKITPDFSNAPVPRSLGPREDTFLAPQNAVPHNQAPRRACTMNKAKHFASHVLTEKISTV